VGNHAPIQMGDTLRRIKARWKGPTLSLNQLLLAA